MSMTRTAVPSAPIRQIAVRPLGPAGHALFGVFQAEGRVAEPDRTIIGDGQIIGRIEPLALRPVAIGVGMPLPSSG
jgi:hypothetical protein